LKIERTLLCNPVAVSALCPMLVLSLCVGQAVRCYGQTGSQSSDPPNVAALHEPLASDPATTNSAAPAVARPAAKPDPEMSLDIAKELAVMKARIEQLEAELKSRAAAQPGSAIPATAVAAVPAQLEAAPAAASASPAVASLQAPSGTTAAPAKKEKIAPFSDWDWTWLNGNPRNKDTAFDTKFFTPEIRADVTYTYDLNKPVDNSMGGSSELFRSNEIQLEQLGVGGDFHYDNVRARLMTQFGGIPRRPCAMTPAIPRGNGLSTTRTAIWRKRTAVITSTCSMGSTSTREFSCPTSACLAITTTTTRPTNPLMFPLTHRGFSRACASRFSPTRT
jgi:hypothetical protein